MTSFRYLLTRDLGLGLAGTATWVMLNPSIADQDRDDPTIRKVKNFTRLAGKRHINVVNLYPIVSTDPRQLFQEQGLEGAWSERNYEVCTKAIDAADLLVFAWGTFHDDHYFKLPQATPVRMIAAMAGKTPMCLGLTKNLQPRHPGRISYSSVMRGFV